MRYSPIAVTIAAGLLTSCTVGPNYVRPTVQVPQNFRAPEPLPAPQAASLADLRWFEIFKDEQLQELTRTALVQNYDLRDAVARVEQERDIAALHAAPDAKQVAAFAHRLRGAARVAGATLMAEQAARVEAAAERHDLAGARCAAVGMEELLTDTLEAMRSVA